MTKAATAIRKILREHPTGLTLSGRREIGSEVENHLERDRGGHGMDVLGRLAAEVRVSTDSLRQAHRLFHFWGKRQVRELDAQGVPWRYVLALVPLARRVEELKKGAGEYTTAERRSAAARIERALNSFVEQAIRGEVRHRDFELQVRQWRVEHIDLWSPGSKRAALDDARKRAESGCERALAALDEMEKLGVDGLGQARRSLESAARVIRKH